MTPTTDLQKLLAEATKGPWRTCNVLPDLGHIYGSIGRLATSIGGETNRTKANARLIAMAPDLAARVLELEAENKRLREAIADARLIAVDAQLRATYQKTALERISDLLRTALKGGE